MSAQRLETVTPGTRVKVRGLVPGAETIIHFVRESEINYFHHKLPPDGLLGQALRNVAAGEKFHVDALGNGPLELTVVEVGRD